MSAPNRISAAEFRIKKEITFGLESRDIALNSVFGRAEKLSEKQDQKSDLILANISSIEFREIAKKNLGGLRSDQLENLKNLIFSNRARGPPFLHVLIL